MRRKQISCTAIALLVVPTIVWQCGGDGAGGSTNPIILHKCEVNQVISYAGELAEGDVYVDEPAECPISLSTPGTNFQFSATGEFAPGTFWNHQAGTSLDIINANGTIVKHTNASLWTIVNPDPTACDINCPSHDVVYVADQYPAGTAGFSFTDPKDQADLRIFKDELLWHRYVGDLPYRNVPGLTASGPSGGDVMPDTPFDVDASLHDLAFVPPVTWQWTHNGIAQPNNTNHMSWPGGDPGTTHEFQVTVTDANGLSWTTTTEVNVKSCNTQTCIQ